MVNLVVFIIWNTNAGFSQHSIVHMTVARLHVVSISRLETRMLGLHKIALILCKWQWLGFMLYHFHRHTTITYDGRSLHSCWNNCVCAPFSTVQSTYPCFKLQGAQGRQTVNWKPFNMLSSDDPNNFKSTMARLRGPSGFTATVRMRNEIDTVDRSWLSLGVVSNPEAPTMYRILRLTAKKSRY